MSRESTIFNENVTISPNDRTAFDGEFFINASCYDDEHNLNCSLINKAQPFQKFHCWTNFTLTIEQATKLRDALNQHIERKKS